MSVQAVVDAVDVHKIVGWSWTEELEAELWRIEVKVVEADYLPKGRVAGSIVTAVNPEDSNSVEEGRPFKSNLTTDCEQ
jgi:hypothetical protein